MLTRARRLTRRLADSARTAVDAAVTFGTDQERRAARERIWSELDPELKRAQQWLGTISAGCFATHQVYERCDFSCTACYLGKEANDTPPLPFEEVKKQIDEVRAYAGPGSNLQITAGEVTLLPVEDLCRITKYATEEAGLDIMVMSHGQNFMRNPGYLETLIREGNVQKVAIHIDTTQRGRDGWDKETMTDEPSLDWIRDDFAQLIRDTREKTGVHLHAAHTMTVTEDNFDDIPHVMNWMKHNNDAFRMISFQPTAAVGRTRVQEQVQKQDLVWQKIGEGLGIENINPHTFDMGHPKCNNTSLSYVVKWGEPGEEEVHAVEVVRNGEEMDLWFWEELMNGAFRDFYLDGFSLEEAVGRFVGMFARSPKYLWQWPSYSARRAWLERDWMLRFFKAVATGKPFSIKPLIIVVHNFMSSHELDTPEGQERLEACGFRLPVDGRMVPMCEMNGTDLRTRKNLETQERLVNIEGWKPKKKKKKSAA